MKRQPARILILVIILVIIICFILLRADRMMDEIDHQMPAIGFINFRMAIGFLTLFGFLTIKKDHVNESKTMYEDNKLSRLGKKVFPKQIFIIFGIVMLTSFWNEANSQVTVAGSGGAANGTYTTLKLAFVALNGVSTQSGNTITISITANITDNNSAVLNQPSVSSWTSLTITPSGGSWTLSGSVNAPLMDLNGADNVTINGLNSSGNALTLSNTSQSNTTGTSTIRFINDASNNTITNCTLLGSTLGSAVQVGLSTVPAAATILIAGSNGSTGNDNNMISNNTIAEAGINDPVVAICSAGQSASITNDNCVITGNNIVNFFSDFGANGIAIASNSAAFTITSNKLYQSTVHTSLLTDRYLHHIVINTPTGGGYVINSNIIGYATSAGTGMLTNTGGRFSGIDLMAVAASPVTDIQGNTINGINWTSSFSSANNAPFNAFNAIAVRAGGVNIGTTTGNIIGATSGTGTSTSNLFISNTNNPISICMIYVSSTTSCTISNNVIGAVTTGLLTNYVFGIVAEGTASHTILSNSIGNDTPGNIILGNNDSNAGYFRGITCTATGNDIIGNAGQGNKIQHVSFTSSNYNDFIGISVANNPLSMNINYNIIQDIVFSNAFGQPTSFVGITNTGGIVNALNINNNQLGTATYGLVFFLTTQTLSGTLTGITSANISPTCTMSISNNDFRGITQASGFSNETHRYITWSHANAVTDNINNNTFTNLNIKSGTLSFLTRAGNMTATGIENINGNSIVTGFTKSGGNSNIYFFDGGGTSSTSAIMNNLNNSFSNVTLLDQSAVNGWENRDGTFGVGGPIKNITGNTFQNINAPSNGGFINGIYVLYYGQGSSLSNNTIRNFSTGSVITGLNVYSPNTSTGSLSIADNIIGDLTNAQAYIYGMDLRSYNCIVTRNKLFNYNANHANSFIRGIYVDLPSASGLTIDINNNLIGNLNTVAATGSNALVGLYISSSITSTINVDYNTIYLASSGSNGFGSSGIYHDASTTTATGLLTLRNNIIINNSTPGTGGLTVAFRRSSGSASMLNNYSSTSNNNLFYAGTPSASRLIYYDGVSSAVTLNSYKGAAFTAGIVAPRDAFSVSEPITAATFFTSTTGSDPGFLHINPSNPTQVENGGMVIGTTTDYDGETRNGTTPDIGADEGAFTFNDLLGPTITYTPIVKGAVTNTQPFPNVIITDVSNVEGTAGIRPRVYYKRSTDANVYNDNTNASAGWKYVEANTSSSPFDFTLNYTLLSGGTGLAVGNTVQYFVVAQDQHAPVNLGLQSGVFSVEPSTVILPASAFPLTGNIKSFPIVNSMSGTITVPGNYPTLTGASGAFDAINSNVVTGNINIEIIGNSPNENGVISLNEFAAPFTIKIYPTGVARNLSGTANSGGIIKLNGADRVTIDGSIGGTGTDRSLSIFNNSTSFPSLIAINSLGTGAGATQNTIKNCNISNLNFNHSSYGISIGGVTPGSSGADNDDITIQNNNITTVSTAIYVNGTTSSSTGGNDNLNILNNSISTNTSAPECNGIRIGNSVNALVKGNTIDLTSTNSVYPVGISLETGCVSSQISSNLITAIRATANTYGARGIVVGTGSTSSDLTIANNVIYNVWGQDNSDITKSSMGICIGLLGNTQTTTPTGGINLYYNSINMFASSGNANTITTALYAGLSCNNLDIRNNIFANSNTGSNSTIKNYAIYSATSNAAFANINYNDYFSNNPNNQSTSVAGFLNSDRIDIAAIQAGFGQNVNSIISNPSFVSNVDLRPASGSVVGVANTAGTGITVDYLNVTRNAGAPPNGSTMGAYENGFDNSPPVILYTVLQSTCSTSDRTLTTTITDVTGVPTTGTLMPRIYFKKNAGSYFSSPGVLTSGTGMNGTWTFTINGVAMGGIAVGDVISYFVIAQDNSVPIKISSNPSAGLVATNVNSVTTPPTTPNSYSIVYTLGAGTYSVGAGTVAGEIGHFQTLTSAILGYNTACLTGAPVFVLTDNTYGSETFPITLNQNVQASAVNSLTIKPAQGISPVISGSASTSLIDIVGGDYVIIDGSNNGTTTKNLTFSNTNTSGAVIKFSNDATNNSIKNCILKGVCTSSSTGIVYIASTTLTGGNDFNLIQNNDITSGNTANANGIFNSGNTTSTTLKNSGLQIIGNNIYNFSNTGIFDNGGSAGTLYLNNQIYEVNTQFVSQLNGFSCVSNTVEGFAFRGNRIYDMFIGGGGLLQGVNIIALSTGPSSVGEISNNMIALYGSNGSMYGILDYCPSGTNFKIDFNSVSISGSPGNNSNCYFRGGTSTTEFKNNIISNTRPGSGYGMYIWGGSLANFTADYNNIYASQANIFGNYANTNLFNISAWRTATNQDQHSLSVEPAFQSNSNLHLVNNGNCSLEGAGLSGTGINIDMDADNRNSPPDIGADEFIGIPLNGFPAGPDQSICNPNTTMAATAGPSGSVGTWTVLAGTGSFSPNANSPTAFVYNLSHGLNTFKWTVTYGSCSVNSNMNITNNSPAVTQCPGDIQLTAPVGSCTAVVNYTVSAIGTPSPTFGYEFNGATTTNGSGTGSGSQFNIGLTYVFITVSNGCGSDAYCNFTIEVRAPEISVSGNNANIPDGQTIPSLTNHTDFDTTIINTNRTRTYTISNTSTVVMTIGAITFTGANASMFTASPPPVSSLNGGDSTTLTVTFTPTSVGIKTATIHIANSDCDESDFDFAISGIGNTKYYFHGSGSWTDQNNWTPSYPGLNIPVGIKAYAENSESMDIPSTIKVTINGDLDIPSYANAFGDITIGSQGSFSVGYMEFSDTLLIQSGGQLNVHDGGLYIHNYGVGSLLNHGTATINNCQLTNESFVYNYPGATFISNYYLINYALFENHGTFIANGTIEGWIQNMPDGTMKIADVNRCLYNWDQLTTQGTLELDIDGATNNCTFFDKIYGQGYLELAGILKLNINYSPANNDAITILEGGALANQFVTLDAPPGWTVYYNDPSSGKVTVKYNCNPTTITSQPLYTQKVCQDAIPSTIAVSATGTGLQYQWYQDTWYEGYNGTVIVGATSPTYIPPTTVPGTYYFYAKVTGQCGQVYSEYSEMNVDARGTWVGATSSDWHTAVNWCGGVPDLTTDVFISPKPFSPIVSTANATCRTIFILPPSTLNINAPRELRVKG